jgi:hypothetical protein
MSDPVTNAEVEDVLSSIRRLVSEDKRPLQAPKPAPVNDRLVLTPALRVADGEADTPKRSEPPRDINAYTVPRSVPDRPENQPEPATPPLRSDWARGMDEDRDQCEDDVEDLSGFDTAATMSDVDDDNWDAPWRDEDDHPHASASDPFDDNFEYAISEQADVPDENLPSEQADEDDTPAPVSSDELSARETRVRRRLMAAAAGTLASDPQPDAPSSKGETAEASLSAKIAALETAVSKIPENWEPDEPGTDAYSGTAAPTMAWEDDIVRDATGALMDEDDAPSEVTSVFRRHMPQDSVAQMRDHEAKAEAQTEEAAEDANPAATSSQGAEPDAAADPADLVSDDQILDEDALRDLISDIVRAELQGALGERITRNVRKLVRREIHRALTAQELE